MVMTANGLAKLAEELGELQQVVGKMLAYGVGEHPDGKGPLLQRFEEEAADVKAAIDFVAYTHNANSRAISKRSASKFHQFDLWHMEPEATHE